MAQTTSFRICGLGMADSTFSSTRSRLYLSEYNSFFMSELRKVVENNALDSFSVQVQIGEALSSAFSICDIGCHLIGLALEDGPNRIKWTLVQEGDHIWTALSDTASEVKIIVTGMELMLFKGNVQNVFRRSRFPSPSARARIVVLAFVDQVPL